jgi:nucleotide-binding universal stress UspA family protein
MKILLATDGSDSANSAIDYLLSFPLPADSEIILLNVIEKELYQSRKKSELNTEQQELLEQTKQMLRDEAEELLKAATQRLAQSSWRCSNMIRAGHPSREIVRTAKKQAVDLVVVGSHGLGGIKRFLLGSVSDKVLAYAPCSVLIVKTQASEISTTATEVAPTKATATALRLLLAYDDSVPAKRAVDFCAALPLDDSTQITALTVLPLMTLYRQDIKQRLSWVWKEKKKLAEKALEDLVNEVKWGTSQLVTQLREANDVSQEILTTAEQSHANLIVVGHKGKGAIEKFLLGSVTIRIAHHSACSVLAVRSNKTYA